MLNVPHCWALYVREAKDWLNEAWCETELATELYGAKAAMATRDGAASIVACQGLAVDLAVAAAIK